ncbi:MAG: FGGY-family carbohydrate kinase [Lachnospiraceae bacterium]
MELKPERIVLVYDVGTQSTRALLINNRGEILGKVREKHDPPYFSLETDWAEQRADFYYEKVCTASQKLKAQFPEDFKKIEAVSVTTIRDTSVCVDKKGVPIRNAFLWLDNRNAQGKAKFSGMTRMMLKGVGMEKTADLQYRKSRCNWMMEQEPELWEKTDKFLLISGYLIFCLTGRMADSAASMVGHIPFDHRRRGWQKESALIRPVFNIPDKMLCEIVEPGSQLGKITQSAQEKCGVPQGIPVIATGSDKACEILGLGCITKEKAAISFGTTATITFTTDKYVEPERFIPPYASILNQHYNPEIEIYRGYWLVSWFKKEFAQKELVQAEKTGSSAEEILNQRLKEIPPGCEGLILQPYFTPNTTMPSARGAIIGFSDKHTRLHIYRAIIEGINFALLEGMHLLEKQSGNVFSELYVGGGGAQSDEICQITADMFGLPVKRTQTYEVSGIGSALTCFVGLGEFADYQEAVKNMVKDKDAFLPDMQQHAVYKTLYEDIFKNIYGRLAPLYARLHEIYRKK